MVCTGMDATPDSAIRGVDDPGRSGMCRRGPGRDQSEDGAAMIHVAWPSRKNVLNIRRKVSGPGQLPLCLSGPMPGRAKGLFCSARTWSVILCRARSLFYALPAISIRHRTKLEHFPSQLVHVASSE